MTLLAILMVIGLLLNVALSVLGALNMADQRKRFELREEMDEVWRESITNRGCKLERGARR